MARLNVKPTRMELATLKRRLKTSTRGHKLLKDKQDELMKQFIQRIRENHQLRQRVEKQLQHGMQAFVLAKTSVPEAFIEESFALPLPQKQVTIDVDNIMSVAVPTIKYNTTPQKQTILPYGLLNSTAQMDEAIDAIQSVCNELLTLAQIEKTCQLLADDIEKTRRRVNALEHLIIPQLQETIAYIQMKLEENERSNIVRILKVKSNTSERN